MPTPLALSPEQAGEVAARYNLGESAKSIGSSFCVTAGTVLRAVRTAGVAVRPSRVCIYHCDESAFEAEPVPPAAAFFAALMFTDGCVYSHGVGDNMLAYEVAERDRPIVERFRVFLGSDHPIRVRKNSGFPGQRLVGINITSRRLVSSLARFNVVPRKTLTASVPESMLDNPHWWRGCIDGDGWITTERRKCRIRLGLCGTRTTVEQFAGYIQRVTGKVYTISRNSPSGLNWAVTAHSSAAIAVIRNLYSDGADAIPRKAEVAAEILRRFPD